MGTARHSRLCGHYARADLGVSPALFLPEGDRRHDGRRFRFFFGDACSACNVNPLSPGVGTDATFASQLGLIEAHRFLYGLTHSHVSQYMRDIDHINFHFVTIREHF